MMEVLDLGAEDMTSDEECIEITAAPACFAKISEYLESKGYTLAEGEIKMVPSIKKELSEEEIIKLENFIDKLESNDDVQNVWHNADI